MFTTGLFVPLEKRARVKMRWIVASKTLEWMKPAYAADFAVFPRQSRIAVELPREKAVVFFDFSGTTVARASYPYYTAAMRPQDNSLLTALYPDEHRGTTLYRLEPDGEPRRLHSLHAIGDFAVVSADTYAVIADDAVELRDIESGALRRSLAAPGAGRFRDIAAAFLEDGSVAVALSGRGGVDEHRLLWFSPGNLVEYDRSGPHHSHAVARSGPCEVLVALEDRIERLERPRCGAR